MRRRLTPIKWAIKLRSNSECSVLGFRQLADRPGEEAHCQSGASVPMPSAQARS